MTYSVPFRIRLSRQVMRPIFRGLFHILGGVEIRGVQNVPKKSAYIISFNHVSIFDPPFAVAFWPVAPEVLGAAEIWGKPGQSTLVRLYGGIQLARTEYDREALDISSSVLKSGRPLVISPEGGRSHTPGMRRAKAGIAFLVEKTGVPVVPVGIVGTTDDYFTRAKRGERPRLEMNIGAPIYLPPLAGSGEERRISRQRHADLVMVQIASLLPPEYHGVYGESFNKI